MKKFYIIRYTIGTTEHELFMDHEEFLCAACAELATKYDATVTEVKQVNYILYGVDANNVGHEFVWYVTNYDELMWLRREHAGIVARYYTEYLD